VTPPHPLVPLEVVIAPPAPAGAGRGRAARDRGGHRGRGYGTAVTAACTADALVRGAARAVLYTDLGNPTSNWIYQRIGYRPVTDHRMVRFG
jgi:GNAT superfamily N-acetyltransferase